MTDPDRVTLHCDDCAWRRLSVAVFGVDGVTAAERTVLRRAVLEIAAMRGWRGGLCKACAGEQQGPVRVHEEAPRMAAGTEPGLAAMIAGATPEGALIGGTMCYVASPSELPYGMDVVGVVLETPGATVSPVAEKLLRMAAEECPCAECAALRASR